MYCQTRALTKSNPSIPSRDSKEILSLFPEGDRHQSTGLRSCPVSAHHNPPVSPKGIDHLFRGSIAVARHARGRGRAIGEMSSGQQGFDEHRIEWRSIPFGEMQQVRPHNTGWLRDPVLCYPSLLGTKPAICRALRPSTSGPTGEWHPGLLNP